MCNLKTSTDWKALPVFIEKENKHNTNADCCLLIHMGKKKSTHSLSASVSTTERVCVCGSGSLRVCITRLRAKMQFLSTETMNCKVG